MPDLNDNSTGAADDGDELAELRALAGRVGPAEVTWETPPADLWDRIASEADLADEAAVEPAAGLDETAIIEHLPEHDVDLDATVGDLPTLTVPGNSGLDPTGVIRLPDANPPLEDTPVSGMTTPVHDDALGPTAVIGTLPPDAFAADVRPEPTEADETASSAPDGPASSSPADVDAGPETNAVDSTVGSSPGDAGPEAIPVDSTVGSSPGEAGPEATPIDSTVGSSPGDAGPEATPIDSTVGSSPGEAGAGPAVFDWTNPPDPAAAEPAGPIDEPLPVPADITVDPEATAFDGAVPPPPVEADDQPAVPDGAAPEVHAEAVPADTPDPSAPAGAPVDADLEATAFDGTAPPVPAAIDPDATADQETLPPPPAESDEIAFDGSMPDPPPDPEVPESGPGATVHGLDAARSRRKPGGGFALGDLPRWVLVAAAIVLVLGIGGLITRLGSGDDTKVVAASKLEPLGESGKGQAELVDRNGSLQLQVDATGVDAGDGFLEVWVIDPEIKKLISLGPLRRDGIYDLPKRYDPKDFPIVDVSIEPVDGNPAHSGISVLRGTLET